MRRTAGQLLLVAIGLATPAAAARAQCPSGAPPPCERPASAVAAGNTVAVLVFENRARDTSLSLLAEGLADEITTNLSRVPRIQVRSSASVRLALSRGTRDPVRLGQALNARYLVDGALLPGASRVRISVQLVELPSGRVRWSTVQQRPTDDLFGLIASVSDSVAAAIAGTLAPSERTALTVRPTRSTAAYDLYLRGRIHLRRQTERDLQHAIVAFGDAIALDSTFVRAWAALSTAWTWSDGYLAARSVYPLARVAADRALALDSSSGEALAARAEVAVYYEWDFAGGERLARRALAHAPRDGRARLALSYALRATGTPDQVAAEAWQALAADSADEGVVFDAGNLLMEVGRYAESRRAHDLLLAAGDHQDRAERLAAELDIAQGRCGPRPAVRARSYAAVYCWRGADSLRGVLDREVAQHERGEIFLRADRPAHWYAVLGDFEKALAWFARAIDDRAGIVYFGLDESWRPMHVDPRYIELMRRARLPIPR